MSPWSSIMIWVGNTYVEEALSCPPKNSSRRYCFLDRYSFSQVQTERPIGSHMTVDKWGEGTQILLLHLLELSGFRENLLDEQRIDVLSRDFLALNQNDSHSYSSLCHLFNSCCHIHGQLLCSTQCLAKTSHLHLSCRNLARGLSTRSCSGQSPFMTS